MNIINYEIFAERFTYYFNGFGIKFNEKMLQSFYIFTEYLLIENEKYNLTSITNLDDIIVKHYVDSIIALKYFNIPEKSSLIDIGAGAGFPSIPLKIKREDLNITFLDSSNKKINFIKNASKKLNQSENIFFCGRAEEFGKDSKFKEKYDFAVSRAVAKLNILCEFAAPIIKPGGYFIVYKSKNSFDEIKEAKNALKILDLEITETAEFNISLKINNNINNIITDEINNKRVLIKIKKLKKTSPEYPRNFSNITKNPL